MWQEFCLLRRARESEEDEDEREQFVQKTVPCQKPLPYLVTGPRAETARAEASGRPLPGASFSVVLFQKGSQQPHQSKPVPCSETLVLGPQMPSEEDGFKNKTDDFTGCMWSDRSLRERPTQYGCRLFSLLLMHCSFFKD